MSKRLQVVMDDEEYEEVQEAADARRLTVSAWVRAVLREARLPGSPSASAAAPTPPAGTRGAPTSGAAGASAEGGVPQPPLEGWVSVDEALLGQVMDRYRFPTRHAAVHFALARAADPPMTRDELLSLQGSGYGEPPAT